MPRAKGKGGKLDISPSIFTTPQPSSATSTLNRLKCNIPRKLRRQRNRTKTFTKAEESLKPSTIRIRTILKRKRY